MLGITAVSCVELTKVVASDVLPNITVDCGASPVPVTVSVVSGLPAFTVVGEMVLIADVGFTTVTEAEALRVVSTTLVAVAVTTLLGEGGTAGPVYNPVELIVPTVPFPPATPFTDQLTP